MLRALDVGPAVYPSTLTALVFEPELVIIRLGKWDDSSAIKAIDSSIGSDPNRAELIDSSLEQGTVRVALDDSEIVGYSILNYSFFHRPTLEMLMVAESRRGAGIGRGLLREAQASLGENHEIWTSTNESNGRMQL